MKKHLFGILAVLLTVCILLTDQAFANAGSLKMSVKILNTKRTVTVGGKLKLNAKIIHMKKGAKLVYSSSKRKIATVNAKGVISGKKAGKSKITIKIKGEKIKKVITVTVKSASNKTGSKQTSSPNKPNPSAKPQVSGKPSPTVKPQESDGLQSSDKPQPSDKPQASGMPYESGEPQPSGKPQESDGPQSPANPSVPPSQDNTGSVKLILYQGVMDIDGEKMTVFLVNKKYVGKVRFGFNGKEFAYSGNANEMIKLLANSGTTVTNKDKTIRLSRNTDKNLKLEEYWTIEDLQSGEKFEFKAVIQNTVKPEIADCGALFFKGDVTSVMVIH